MSDQSTTFSALHFPKDLSISDTNCVVCMDDARKPVFCTTCKKLHCFDCMTKCQRENGCAICRTKASQEVFITQCDKYSCDKHSLLLTLVCTDCNVCICKQCMGKESDHALHAFKNIDDIRADLNVNIHKLHEYLKMVDGIESIGKLANNLGDGNLLNIRSLGIDQLLRNKVSQLVEDVEAFGLKDLIHRRIEIKHDVEELLGEIGKNKEQEPQIIYDFSSFPMSIELLSTSPGTLHVRKFDDGHGNFWEFKMYPNHKKLLKSVSYVSFNITLLSGTPGRYELKIDCIQPNIHYQKVLEIKSISDASGIYKIWPNLEEQRELVLNVGLRPTNFKYHLQCARLYRVIANDPNRKDYVEKMYTIEKNFTTGINNFFRDETGTVWRFVLSSYDHEGVTYLSAYLEHYDGAVGRFDFFIKIENKLNALKAVIKKFTKDFTYGQTLHIKKLLTFPAERHQYVYSGATQLLIGIRPAVQSSKVGIIQRIFSK